MRLNRKKNPKHTLLATFSYKIQKILSRWFLPVSTMTHAKSGLLNFSSANSIAKVQKSPKSEISKMSFPVDSHDLQVWNNYLRIGIFKDIEASLLWNCVYGICFFVKLYKVSWWQINSVLSIGLNLKFYMLLYTYCFQKSRNCDTVGIGLQVNNCITYINGINI